jgi:hypothetical protein
MFQIVFFARYPYEANNPHPRFRSYRKTFRTAKESLIHVVALVIVSIRSHPVPDSCLWMPKRCFINGNALESRFMLVKPLERVYCITNKVGDKSTRITSLTGAERINEIYRVTWNHLGDTVSFGPGRCDPWAS